MNHAAENRAQPESGQTEWNRIAASEQFRDLLAVKKTFIVPAFVIFFVHYLSLAVLVGYVPKLAATRVIGTVNVAYLFALSQFAVGWIIAALYLIASSKFDRLTKDILRRGDAPQGGK